jgi:hypothetical protein
MAEGREYGVWSKEKGGKGDKEIGRQGEGSKE